MHRANRKVLERTAECYSSTVKRHRGFAFRSGLFPGRRLKYARCVRDAQVRESVSRRMSVTFATEKHDASRNCPCLVRIFFSDVNFPLAKLNDHDDNNNDNPRLKRDSTVSANKFQFVSHVIFYDTILYIKLHTSRSTRNRCTTDVKLQVHSKSKSNNERSSSKSFGRASKKDD